MTMTKPLWRDCAFLTLCVESFTFASGVQSGGGNWWPDRFVVLRRAVICAADPERKIAQDTSASA